MNPGTWLLAFTAGCNALSGNAAWGAVSVACVLAVAIYALAGISGASFNPACSLALAFSSLSGGPGMDALTAVIYAAVQTAAALVGAICSRALFAEASFTLAPRGDFSMQSANVCEALYTCMLVFVVLNVAVAGNNSPNQFFGVAISLVVVASAYGAGAVSGGGFNPAIAFAFSTASGSYIAAEFVGALLAVMLFQLVRPEDFGRSRGLLAEVLSEFLGTFMLMLTVGLNVLARSPAGALSIAAALVSMVLALGNVSGGHFNPAVTLACFSSGSGKDFGTAKACLYLAVQTIAALAAAAAYHGIYAASLASQGGIYFAGECPKSVADGGGSWEDAERLGYPFARLGPGSGHTLGQACIAEAIFTSVLVYAVLHFSEAKAPNSTALLGLAIGSVITAGGNAVGAISGGVLNPAVAVGLAAGHRFAGGPLATPTLLGGYALAELAGALVAVGFFRLARPAGLADAGGHPDDEQLAVRRKSASTYGSTREILGA